MLVGVAEAADYLHMDRRSVHRAVERGALTPAQKLPGLRGAFVFHRADIVALAAARRAAPTSSDVVAASPRDDAGLHH